MPNFYAFNQAFVDDLNNFLMYIAGSVMVSLDVNDPRVIQMNDLHRRLIDAVDQQDRVPSMPPKEDYYAHTSVGIQAIVTILESMKNSLVKKGDDYSGRDNTFLAFEEGAAFAGHNVVSQFRSLLGIKVARIKNLHRSAAHHQPNNETLIESYMDLANYLVLYMAFQMVQENKKS